jgi:hypothetical protein
MIEFNNKVFIGNWREINSIEYQYGSIEINSNGESKLSILGDYSTKYNNKRNIPETIVGNFVETDSRKCFTIILHKHIGRGGTMSALSNFYFIYQFTLVGDKAVEESIQNLHFNEIMVSSDFFQERVTTDDIEITNESIDGPILYKINRLAPNEVYKDEFQRVYIWWRGTYPLSNSHKLIIESPAWLNISFTYTIDIVSCFEQKNKIEQFFTFLNKQHISFDYFEIVHTSGLVLKVLGIKKGTDWGIKRQYLDLLKNNSFEYYRNWLNIYERIGFATSTFHNALVDKDLSVENKFLSFCFSLELYHREFYSKFEPVVKRNSQIINKIGLILKGKGDLETWFNKFATSTREVHFKNRISDLLRDSNLDLSFDHEEYAERIKDTRNKLVHLEDSQKNPFSKEELIQNVKKVSDLFIDHLYNKISSFEAKDD